MRRQAERMTAIIRDLLELSRLEETDEIVGGEPIDVAALMAMLRKDVLARPVHPARGAGARRFAMRMLIGDEPEIHSAFSNLVDNAAKYTPAEGSIEMRWWVDEEGGHFSVTDTGIGIPPDHIPRLTERFYRVDAGRSRATGGSGLGLAIVKHVLQRHGATLEVRSIQGAAAPSPATFRPQRIASGARACRPPQRLRVSRAAPHPSENLRPAVTERTRRLPRLDAVASAAQATELMTDHGKR